MGTVTDSQLKQEFDYFLEHQKEIVAKYHGRVVVIKDRSVIGDYANEAEAVTETVKKHALGTFLVQLAEPGTDSYSQTFYSRVAVSR